MSKLEFKKGDFVQNDNTGEKAVVIKFDKDNNHWNVLVYDSTTNRAGLQYWEDWLLTPVKSKRAVGLAFGARSDGFEFVAIKMKGFHHISGGCRKHTDKFPDLAAAAYWNDEYRTGTDEIDPYDWDLGLNDKGYKAAVETRKALNKESRKLAKRLWKSAEKKYEKARA